MVSAVLRAGDVLAERADLGRGIAEAGALFAEREAPNLVEPSALLEALSSRCDATYVDLSGATDDILLRTLAALDPS
ncbi:MAG: hypothetical protein AAFZ09_02385, partial [Pseudomonadota bacterium]